VIDDLRRLADDEDARVRVAAIRSIGLLAQDGCDASLRELALALVDAALADEPLVVLAALEVMRRAGGPNPARLAMLLARPEAEIVREAVACVCALPTPESLDRLLPLVSHPDWSVRAEAIDALAQQRVTRAVPSILRRLETEQDDFVREAILRALAKLEE
jgi:HEAT repeat protein